MQGWSFLYRLLWNLKETGIMLRTQRCSGFFYAIFSVIVEKSFYDKEENLWAFMLPTCS